ncbi:RNA-directed DNA polymerase, eukaryota [Tanacetum coccineum]
MEREDGEFIPGKDDNGWTYVSQRGRKTPTAGKPSTTSFFFTNIPAGATVSSLWKAFAKHDRVSDIYLAKKKTNNEDGNSEDDDESYDDDSREDLFTNEDGGEEQSCGGFCGHLNQDTNVTMASIEFSEKVISTFSVTSKNDVNLSPNNTLGGILNVWDRNLFLKKEVVLRDGFTAIIGNWRDVLGDFVMVNVYAPQNSHAKSKLWSKLLHLKNAKLGFWVCFGDFNVVKEESDRKGTQFDPNTAYSFNKFIDEAEL